MASALQSALASLQLNDRMTVAVVSAIGYDYILTFSREIDYVWNKPWTSVSTLYILIRYLGLLGFLTLSIAGTSFATGSANLFTQEYFQGLTFGLVNLWAVSAFICAADLVMILRVWAMYNRSRTILGVLLTTYTVEVILTIIGCIIYTIPGNVLSGVVQILDVSVCSTMPVSPKWNQMTSISQLVHAAMMFVLVVIQFTRQSLRMFNAMKQWRLNKFMNLIVMEGGLYFLAILLWNLMSTLSVLQIITGAGWRIIPLGLVEAVPIPTLTPRFLLNMRELYAHNVQGEHRNAIDSAFGLTTVSTDIASKMIFADGKQNGEFGDEDVMMMEISE